MSRRLTAASGQRSKAGLERAWMACVSSRWRHTLGVAHCAATNIEAMTPRLMRPAYRAKPAPPGGGAHAAVLPVRASDGQRDHWPWRVGCDARRRSSSR